MNGQFIMKKIAKIDIFQVLFNFGTRKKILV